MTMRSSPWARIRVTACSNSGSVAMSSSPSTTMSASAPSRSALTWK
jgi:hypothetical protein